jgi:hypothetical protein
VTPCKGLCKGTDRPATDAPCGLRKTNDGRTFVWCDCCEAPLRLTESKSDITPGRLSPEIEKPNAKRFECPRCEYDYVLMVGPLRSA